MKKLQSKIKQMLESDDLEKDFDQLDQMLAEQKIKSKYVSLARSSLYAMQKHLHNALNQF